MNEEKSKLQELMESLGIMSETLFLFYKNLLKTGFNEDQAMSLTASFLKATLNNAFSQGENS